MQITRSSVDRHQMDEQAKHIFFGILLLPAFRMAKCGESSMFFFFCCVFYTRQIGNYVYFIVFFHGYFRKNCMAVHSLISLFPSLDSLHLKKNALINCKVFIEWSTHVFPMISYQFFSVQTRVVHFHINYLLNMVQSLGRNESSPSEYQIRCMIFPFTIVHLIAVERCISLCIYFLRLFYK